jgi:putative cell wall-binding protein
MLAASGNAKLFDSALADLGAAPARDDIFGALGYCPIVPRDYSDQAIAFLRFWWLDFSTVDKSGKTAAELLNFAVNEALVQSFKEYMPTLELTAEREVGSVKPGDAITADNLLEYFYPYLKQSCIDYLNNENCSTIITKYGSLQNYLDSIRQGGSYPGMQVSTLVKPIFASDGTTVIDLDGDYLDIWKTWIEYVYQVPGFGAMTNGQVSAFDPFAVDNLFDKPYMSPNIQDNGILPATAPDYGTVTTVGTRTFGKGADWANTYSPFGLDWIESHQGVTVSDEYRELYKTQCLAMDPMYFIRNAEELGVDVAPAWFIRTGAADTVALPIMFLSLTTTLENNGYLVDSALTWDGPHVDTTPWPLFFDWQAAIDTLDITRLMGEDRYQTAKDVSLFARDGADVETVIIASGEDANFPDALCASALSGQNDNAPIVLTSRNTLSAAAKEAIEAVSPANAIIVGGASAVSAATAQQLADLGLNVTRLGGADRQATAELIYASAAADKWSTGSEVKTAVIATNANYADALTIAPYAAKTATPVFLTEFGNADITAETKAALAAGGFKRIIVVGGTTAVPQSVVDSALTATKLSSAELVRLGGETRYETATKIAAWATDTAKRMPSELLSYDMLAVARGDHHADALSSGALQGLHGAVILLTEQNNRAQAKDAIATNTTSIKEIRFLGGTNAIPEAVLGDYVSTISHNAVRWPNGNKITGIR